MAWLEPENFQCLKAFHGHLAWVDACQHGMSFAKSWCFASNNPCIQHVAARCNHPKKHASIAGVRSTSGQFLSTLTAEYPATLAASLVTHCATRWYTSFKNPASVACVPTDSKSVMEPACIPPQTIQYPSPVTRTVAHAWVRWATIQNLIPKILAHVSSDTPEPPLSAQESEEAALIAFAAVNLPAPTSMAPDNGQPYRLSLLHALASASDDPDIKLLPLLSEGVPAGALSELPRSMQWPLKEHADLPHELTERMGNWKAAEAEPNTVSALFIQGNHAWSWTAQCAG